MATATVLPPPPNQHFFDWVPRNGSTGAARTPRPLRVSSSYTDFSGAFLSANLMGAPSRKRTLTTAIVLHTILIAIPLLLSAWFTDTLDLRTYTQTLLVAPPAAAAPSPPPKVVAATPVQVRRVFTSHGKLFMPTAIPRQVAMLKEGPLAPEAEGVGILGGLPGGATGGVIGGILEGIKAPPPLPPTRPVVENAKAPVPVGGNVQPPRVLYRTAPEYPLLAHQAGIQGEVIISAIIDSHGNVVDMKVVSGPPLLYSAAMKALGEWKFEPTYLNGEAVAIKWNVSVKFRIDR
jgi:TonB family protein